MKPLIYVLLFAVCVFCSCEKESHPLLDYTVETEQEQGIISLATGFIEGYLDADALGCSQNIVENPDETLEYQPSVSCWLGGNTYYDNYKWVTENSRVYSEYASQIGDTAYPQTIYRHVPRFSEIVVVNEIVGIEVICHEDFDEKHKAGCSVSDIINFRGNSPINYIKS